MRQFPLSGENNKPNSDVAKLREYGQDVIHTIFTETVTAEMIDNGNIVLEDVVGVRKIVTKISGTVYKVVIS